MSSRSVRITGGPAREEAFVDGTKNALQVTDVHDVLEGSALTSGGDYVKMAGAERDDALNNIVTEGDVADGDATWLRVDSRGALWVRTAPVIKILSGSTNGRPISLGTTGSPGTVVHVVGTSVEMVWIYATNTTTGELAVTVEFGGTAGTDVIQLKIPANDTRPIVSGQVLSGGLTIRAYAASANVVNVSGYTQVAP